MAVVKRWVIIRAVLPAVRARKRPSQVLLRPGIHGASGLVKDHQGGLPKKRACQGDALPFPPLNSAPPNHLCLASTSLSGRVASFRNVTEEFSVFLPKIWSRPR